MDEITAWTLYHANILGILHHPGNRKGNELTDNQLNDYAAYVADLAIHTWRIRCIQFNTERNLSSHPAHSSADSSPLAPQYTETCPHQAANKPPTKPTTT